jgi:hypothetical protein
MKLRTNMMNLKSKLLLEIAEAAKQGDSEHVLRVGKKLQQVDLCLQRYDEILHEIEQLDTNGMSVNLGCQGSDSCRDTKVSLERTSLARAGREAGARIRRSFLGKLAGLGRNLSPLRGTVYKTPSGVRVGIAVASARQERQKNRWFLGLPDGEFDIAVLLCETVEGEVIDVCLHQSFFAQYGHLLSKSNGQVKFNAYQRSKRFSIKVPSVGDVEVSRFISDYSSIA